MKKLDKYVLVDLGFEKVYVSEEESGDKAFFYYTLDIGEYTSLISNSFDVPVTGKELYEVSLFSHEDMGICYTDEEVKILYKALTRNELKND